MRASLLQLAGAVLLVAVVDFIWNTVPTLGEVARLELEAEQRLEGAISRLAVRGAPPDFDTVERLRDDLAQVNRELERDLSAVFAQSQQTTDYLFPVALRPSTGGLAAANKALELALLPLQLEIREYPALNSLDLGIQFPSATSRWEPTAAAVRDQAERVNLTQWILDCLRSTEGVDLRRCLLGRARPDAPLEAELLIAAGIEDLVPFLERFLSSTIETPPRTLRELWLRRLEPEAWAPDLARYRSPPVELQLKVGLLAPGAFSRSPVESAPDSPVETAAEGGP